MVYGFIETRAVSLGNPYSIVFLWIALDASRRVAGHQLAAPQPPEVYRSEGSP